MMLVKLQKHKLWTVMWTVAGSMEKGLVFSCGHSFYCMILSLKTKHCKCWFTHKAEDILKCLSHFGVKLCVFKYPSSLGLVQCTCCLGEECVMLGFSYLFFIHPLNMVLCLLWWTVYYWHMSPHHPSKFFSVLAVMIIPPMLHIHFHSSVAYP